MLQILRVRGWFGENDNDALIPEVWANESVAILVENMVVTNLIHRDFSPLIAKQGDLVHTDLPAEFVARRKTDADNVTIQDATTTDIQVKLDQHFHTSFMIKDGEESKSMQDLVNKYLRGAVVSIAQAADKVVLGQFPQFFGYSAGRLGQLSSTTAKRYILDARQTLNENKAYPNNRNLIWNPSGETEALDTELFLAADKVGDEGSALREASLGRKLGFNHFMCQNMSYITAGNTVVTGAINLGAGYAVGSTVFVVNGFSAAITNGTFITIAGDDTPLRVSATTGGGTPVSITVATGIKRAVVDTAVITVYTPGEVDQAVVPTGYAAEYAKEITVDGFTVAPQVGQTVAFGLSASSPVYTIIEVNALVGMYLDRPLEEAIADDAKVNIGPAGSYNFAFHRNAITFVSRPLAQPRRGTGALSAVANYNGIAIRVTITYDGNAQGHLVTVDLLCGVKVLDLLLGCVLLG